MSPTSASQYDRRPRPGAMHEPLRLEERRSVVLPTGQESEHWDVVAVIYGEPQMISISEQSIADVAGVQYDRRWRTWYRTDITTTARLIDSEGVTYYITRIDDPDGRRRDMIIYARRAEPRL